MRLLMIGKAKLFGVWRNYYTENVGFSSHRVINGKRAKT